MCINNQFCPRVSTAIAMLPITSIYEVLSDKKIV